MTFTKDQVVAVSRHVVTAVASGVAVAVALGLMGQDDADKAVEMVRQIGEGAAVIAGALGVLLPIVSALFAGKSASPAEQIRKVDQNPTNGVAVYAVNEEGAKTLEKINNPGATP
jgi:hypothetical protein